MRIQNNANFSLSTCGGILSVITWVIAIEIVLTTVDAVLRSFFSPRKCPTKKLYDFSSKWTLSWCFRQLKKTENKAKPSLYISYITSDFCYLLRHGKVVCILSGVGRLPLQTVLTNRRFLSFQLGQYKLLEAVWEVACLYGK